MVYAEYGDGNFLGFDEAAPFVSETEGLADEVDEASDLLSIVQSRAIKRWRSCVVVAALAALTF